jgi:hypothetical protein
MDADGSNVRQVLPFGAYSDFQWLPDGSGFIFYTVVEEDILGNPTYSLAWLDLTCLDTSDGCGEDDIEIIPDTETIQRYEFDVWMDLSE